MARTDPRLGCALILLAAVLFGLNGGVSRVAMGAGLGPESFTTLRITGAMLVFVAYAAVFRRSALVRPRGTGLLLVAALGLVGVAGLQLTYNVAIDRLPLGVALLIEYLAPVLVVLWVRFVRREDVRPRMWAAVALALVGMAVVGRIWNGLAFDGLGVGMALLAAVCFAAYFLLGEHQVASEGRAGRRDAAPDDPLRVMLWAFVVAAGGMNLVQPVWTTPDLPATTSGLGRLDAISVDPWLVIAVVVVLGTVLPFFLGILALRHLPATIVTVVAMLEPVIAVVLGWAWFRESLTPWQVAGAVAVLAGIVLAQTSRRVELAVPVP
jgi:drug/metabolite transporter (DMT)-like permease